MTTLHIKQIKNLLSSDKKPMVYVSADIVNSNFEFTVQPTAITYLEESNNYKPGDNVTLQDDASPIYWLQIENKDPWGLYGSDHNSGVLWFGKSEQLDEIHKKAEEVYLNHVGTLPFANLTDEAADMSVSPIVRWNFDDGNSLIISYVDTDYQQIRSIADIKAKDVISYEFGATIDDRLAHEFLQPYVAKLLKKIKNPAMEIDLDDLGDVDDYPIDVNGKSITSKHNDLLLSLAEHLYCSLLNAHETDGNHDEEPDELNEAFAKKIKKYRLINGLEKPTVDTHTRLTYIYEGSNKEYNIYFKEENNLWRVVTSYGSIGKKMTTDTQISTDNMKEAQEVYLGLLKDKLAKGYDLDESPQLKNKMKI
jgi:hypothetical protein